MPSYEYRALHNTTARRSAAAQREEQSIFYVVRNFYVVRTVHFGMKLYNDQRNAQVFNLFIYLLLPYMFRAFY
jgi:hypothetical protein